MFTVCPKCTLTLAVTAADLRAGQGYVRCGRCANVFNALLGLSEEPANDISSTQPNLAIQVPQAPANEPEPAPKSTAGPVPDVPLSVFDKELKVAPYEAYLTVEPQDDDLTESQGTGTFETIVLEGDGILRTEEFLEEGALDSELAAVARQLAAANGGSDSRQPQALQTTGADANTGPGDQGSATPAPTRRLLWTSLNVLLALLLAAQVVNHWRNELAAKPWLFGPLSKVYSTLGVPLTPSWDLASYDVRQLGAITDGTGSNAIHVRVSLTNRAIRTQPLPVVRLTLLDRYGKRVAARDLQPHDYLPQSQAGRVFMDAEQRIDTEVAVVDPGPDATSFEVDVCLANVGGGLRCANDAPVLTGRPP